MAAAGADEAFMAAALSLAARNLGDTWPNPAVGCILVKDGLIVGRGWTQSGGRPHAETEALKRAGTATKGATAYVTLEPCSHHGQTAPCADALVAAGIARVVIAATDPDPRVSGQGATKLRAAGIEVREGIGATAAQRLNGGFFLRVKQNRPLFALKVATTFDGRIALASGQGQWITGPAARQAAHALRARYDAILVGSGTAVTDDPMLTCRLEGYSGRPKVRVILDRRGRVPKSVKMLTTTAIAPTWVLSSAGPRQVAEDLGSKGITRVLIEGGAGVAAAFLEAGLVDEIACFQAPSLIGGDGVPAVGALRLTDLAKIPTFVPQTSLSFAPDTLTFFERAI